MANSRALCPAVWVLAAIAMSSVGCTKVQLNHPPAPAKTQPPVTSASPAPQPSPSASPMPSAVSSTPGYAITAGGGPSSSAQMSASITIGEPANDPAVVTGSTTSVHSGIQGILYSN